MSAALKVAPVGALPGRLADHPLTCQGARYHSPQPLLLHETLLPDGRMVLLCGTCRNNLGVLQLLLQEHGKELAWPVRREFGNTLRALLIPKESDG
jgi:hypothetical protein